MPSGKGTYLDNKQLDHNLGGPDYTRPATVYVHLWTTLPSRDRSGGVEVTGTGYAALALTNDLTSWGVSVDGVKKNVTNWDFGVAGTSWGTIAGATVEDGSNNMMYYASFSTPVTVDAGQPFMVAAGNATITER